MFGQVGENVAGQKQIKCLYKAGNIQTSMSKVPVMLQWKISRSIYPVKRTSSWEGGAMLTGQSFSKQTKAQSPDFPLRKAKLSFWLFCLSLLFTDPTH